MKLALAVGLFSSLTLISAPAWSATETSTDPVEVTVAVVEAPDGSLCYVDVANHAELIPPPLTPARQSSPVPAGLPACGGEPLKTMTLRAPHAGPGSRPAIFGLETVVPAVCGFAFLTGVGNAAGAIGGREAPLPSGEPGFFFGTGAGLVAGNLAKLTLRGLAMVPGMGVVGAACAMAGEFVTYQVYYLVVPKK